MDDRELIEALNKLADRIDYKLCGPAPRTTEDGDAIRAAASRLTKYSHAISKIDKIARDHVFPLGDIGKILRIISEEVSEENLQPGLKQSHGKG